MQETSLLGDNLLKDISLVGGNESGIFISSVQSGSLAEKVGLREGHHLLLVGTSVKRTVDPMVKIVSQNFVDWETPDHP